MALAVSPLVRVGRHWRFVRRRRGAPAQVRLFSFRTVNQAIALGFAERIGDTLHPVVPAAMREAAE
jgi:hypothetical protein